MSAEVTYYKGMGPYYGNRADIRHLVRSRLKKRGAGYTRKMRKGRGQ
jgi:hypothetical protein